MRSTVALLLLALTLACRQEPQATGTVDTRDPIEILYVGAPELPVHKTADDASPVIATYQNGEAVSVLAKKGDWSEVRAGDGSGWVHAADLVNAEAKTKAEENPTPKFRVQPQPISAPSTKGEIYIEADVNSDGDVLSTRILSNTTGSDVLAAKNAAALQAAKFYPIVVKGERKPFKYYYRVTY